jgi:hypothetical protein
MPSTQWSFKKVNLVTGLACFAGFAVLMGLVDLAGHRRLSLIGDPGGLARWTPVVAALWAASFLPKPTTIVGYRKRTTLPVWLVAPWVALWLGPIEWGGALLYYLPMLAGFLAMARADSKRDDARAVTMPGLKWTQAGEDFSIFIPHGGYVRARFSANPETPLLLRGEPGAGSEVELVLGRPLAAHVEGPLRLVVVCEPDSQHLAFWGNEPVSWTIKPGAA